MARPAAEVTVVLMAALIDGPGTTRELAARTGLNVRAVMMSLDNLVRRGEVCKLAQPARVQGVKRPVPVYARPHEQGDTADEALPTVMVGGMCNLIAAWVGIGSTGGGVRAE